MKSARAVLAAAILATLTTAIGPPVDATPAAPAAPTRAAALLSPSFPSDAYPAYDLGIQNRPSNVAGRDAAVSGLVGETSLWAYGDTFATTGGGFFSNTGALNVQGFLRTREPVDGSGFSADQLIPFTSGEASYNATHTGSSRYWVWPTGIIPRPAPQTSLVFWARGLDPAVTGSEQAGLADVTDGQTVASRRPALFGGQDCTWGAPTLSSDGTYVYLYATMDAIGANRTNCPDGGTFATLERMVARAPLSQAGTKSAYRYWNGSAWDPDQLDAVDVMDLFTPHISWNAELGQYLAIGGFGNTSEYSTAPAPQGPWTTPAPWITPVASGIGYGNYAWANHPEHEGGAGGVLLTTYHRSTSITTGDIKQLAVDVRPDPAAELNAYITRAYQELLGRNPVPSDLTYWSGQLEGRTTTVPTFTRFLSQSDEGLRHLVAETYLEILGRPATVSDQAYWAGELDAHGWGHAILVSKLASSAELSGLYPNNGDYVDAVYPLTLGRPASASDRTYWAGQLAGGMSRATFVRTLMQSDEGGRRQAGLAYQAILGRPATATQAAAVSGAERDALEIRYRVLATAEAIGL